MVLQHFIADLINTEQHLDEWIRFAGISSIVHTQLFIAT